MTFIQNQIDDETVFPSKQDYPFQKDMPAVAKTAMKLLYRILAHLYHCHFDKILALEQEAHLNALFAHFICFSNEFDLLEKKEVAPMQDLISEFEVAGFLK